MIDRDLAQVLKDDFSPENTIRELFAACTKLASAVGIQVKWDMGEMYLVDPDKKAVAKGMTHLVTAMAALQAGSNINPFKLLQEAQRAQRESVEKGQRSSN